MKQRPLTRTEFNALLAGLRLLYTEVQRRLPSPFIQAILTDGSDAIKPDQIIRLSDDLNHLRIDLRIDF